MNEEARQYIDAVPEGKPCFEQLHALILALYPDAEIGMSCQIPTYKTSSGWVALGYWKNGIALYTDDPQHIIEFKDRHPGIKVENGRIHIKSNDALPLVALQQLIRHVIEYPSTKLAT